MDEYVRQEMEDQRERVLKLLSLAFKTKCIERFATQLANAYFEELSSAITIAEDLSLYPIDFIAVLRDEQNYDNLWSKEEENRMEEYRYDSSQQY